MVTSFRHPPDAVPHVAPFISTQETHHVQGQETHQETQRMVLWVIGLS